VGDTRPDLTLFLHVPIAVSEARRQARPMEHGRDRMEEAGTEFFQRVEQGFMSIAKAEPQRVKVIDATRGIAEVAEAVWSEARRLLA
jgi:dTMP kinase